MPPSPLLHPPPLTQGARVGILSPAGPVLEEHLRDGVAILERWGLEPILSPQTLSRDAARGYLAGADRERLEALSAALASRELDAILFSRGGYGTMRLLPALDPSGLREAPKLLVGFSDITALHLWAAHCAGVSTLHGPVLKSLSLHDGEDPSDSLGQLRAALLGERGAFTLDALEPVSPGRVTGPLYGGNLSLVAAMLATPYCPELRGAILFLEDVTEPDYRLDRLLTTLRLSERARGLGGLVLGQFTGCGGVYVDEEQIPTFVASIAAEFDCPVAANLPVGHAGQNVSLPIGAEATLEVPGVGEGQKATLRLHGDCAR